MALSKNLILILEESPSGEQTISVPFQHIEINNKGSNKQRFERVYKMVKKLGYCRRSLENPTHIIFETSDVDKKIREINMLRYSEYFKNK